MVDLREKMLELIRKEGVTARYLCDKFGFTSSQIESWEIGRTKPKFCVPVLIEMLVKVHKEFGSVTSYAYAGKPSDIIRDLRRQAGLSQVQFCQKFKIKRSTFVKWEQGICEVPNYIINMIGTLLAYERTFGFKTHAPEWAKDFKI